MKGTKPAAVTTKVDGNPNFRWFQNDRWYLAGPSFIRSSRSALSDGVGLACSQTIRFAAEPTNVKFPATVLTHAKINQAFSELAPGVAAAEAATLGPNNKTANQHKQSKVSGSV